MSTSVIGDDANADKETALLTKEELIQSLQKGLSRKTANFRADKIEQVGQIWIRHFRVFSRGPAKPVSTCARICHCGQRGKLTGKKGFECLNVEDIYDHLELSYAPLRS